MTRTELGVTRNCGLPLANLTCTGQEFDGYLVIQTATRAFDDRNPRATVTPAKPPDGLYIVGLASDPLPQPLTDFIAQRFPELGPDQLPHADRPSLRQHNVVLFPGVGNVNVDAVTLRTVTSSGLLIQHVQELLCKTAAIR